MMSMLYKKLFGVKYKSAIKHTIIYFVLYMAFSFIDYKFKASLNVFVFSSCFFSTGIMWQVLSSKDNARYLKGFFSLPFDEEKFLLNYCIAISSYTLITKTMFLLILYISFTTISFFDLVIFLVSFIFACLSAMIMFAFFKNKIYISAFIFILEIVLCFTISNNLISMLIYLILDVIFVLLLKKINPYSFMMSSESSKLKNTSVSNTNFLVIKYFFRYILSNKSHVINSIAVIAFGCFFAKIIMTMTEAYFLPVGMAIISVNTPLSILVSSNRKLQNKLDVMPNKIINFFVPYGLIVFVFYIISYMCYIISLFVLGSKIDLTLILIAIFFALQSAIMVMIMENKLIIKKWNVESDLWHNPRKYIVPVILIFETFLIQMAY